MGAEIYLQSTFGSPAFNHGTQPSMSLLFDQSLPLEISFEYNLGITGEQNGQGQIVYQFSYQWSFQRQVVEDFDVFIHGFYNDRGAAAPARLRRRWRESARSPTPMLLVSGPSGLSTTGSPSSAATTSARPRDPPGRSH